ncbi:HCL057Wp [Eremothecium sinecaudum]|uniref:ATPase inhibitor, mitochondrial n=1 Tax=Eremothecium sinecaudum TaxID=45286 RepID=A0A0X8HRG8_9SACH|nr:HCL057Wp [Eremothecium sinecaudum]AMD20094.1 HCL057Wp [Eremothecium sinecaudum]
MLSIIRSRSLGCARLTPLRMYSSKPEGGPDANINSNDAFRKREKAQEDMYVKQHEKEQLKRLREKLQEQQKKIDSLEQQIQK